MLNTPCQTGRQRVRTRFLFGIFFFSVFFGISARHAQAAPIKFLSDTYHAYGDAFTAIQQLLGPGHIVPDGTDVIFHVTNSGNTLSANPAQALNSAATYIEVLTGNAIASQAPYDIFTTSGTGNTGDTVSDYNTYTPYGLTHNYAYSNSPTVPSTVLPPIYRFSPGQNVPSYPSGYGVEWIVDPAVSVAGSLSGVTAANAGMITALRVLHSTSTPAWNWMDVKAALRQTGTNWATGYNHTTYGFGTVNYAAANALTSSQILLQPPVAKAGVSGLSNQISFTLFPFKQTRRVKEVLFQFSSAPAFHASELSLSEITTLGGTKITEYTGTLATTTTPIFATTTNKYFVWFTADNATDSAASFSRIDTYSALGPLSQNETYFNATFDTVTPATNAVSATQSPTFTWGAADSYLGISKYQLFVDGVLNKDNISGTSATPTSALSEGTHTWYVKAINGGGVATTTTSTPTININTAYTTGYTFYVDNVLGSDNNPGTEALPWATLTKAGVTAAAGDTVILIKNTGAPYREMLMPENAGTSGSHVTFRGVDASHKPEIWGSADISSGWSVYGGGGANTYQYATTTDVKVLAVGSSIASLAKKTKGTAAATLNPGEWFWVSNVLYYRLAAGEVMGSIHIEAAYNAYCISGAVSYITYQNIVARYANSIAVSIDGGARAIAQGVEAYDSYQGIFVSGSNVTLRYSVAARNTTNGINLVYPVSSQTYNSLAYGNGTRGVTYSAFTGVMTLKNIIAVANTTYSFAKQLIFGSPTFTTGYNLWDIAGDTDWNTRKGTNNQELVDPLLVDAVNGNFSPTPLSPSVDAGTTGSGATTDILGNPIYGTPDIGPYEYQPPYTIGTHDIDITGGVRLYKNGKYRYTNATTTGTTASFNVTPVGGFPSGDYSEFLNMSITTWNTSGDYAKTWTETSTTATSTVHTIGNLKANTYYNVLVDSTQYASMLTDGSGQGTFTYTGGYSIHTFNITEDTAAPATFSLVSPLGTTGASTQTFLWNASSDASSGIAKYQLYIDGALNQDNITNTSVSTSNISCSSHTWYVRAVDNAGNTTDSSTQTFSVSCGGGPIMPAGTVLFNVPKPRMQTITNGVVTYLDETTGVPTTPSAPAAPSAPPSTTSSAAPSFSRTMTRGAKGNDISALQEILKKDPTVYPEGLVTGFFGPATERAIKRFQKKHNIISSGTPKTTGYGAVGPKTRKALQALAE